MNAILDTLMGQSGVMPYVIVFLLLLMCGLGVPLPEDVVLFGAGLACYYGKANVFNMILVSFAGVMIGDSTVFTIGAVFGRKVRKFSWVKRVLPPKRMSRVRRKLHEQGNKVIFAGRFMPGLRTPIFFSAGTLHLPFRVFFFYDGLAACLSVPFIVYAVYHFGSQVDRVIKIIKRIQFGLVGTIILIVVVLALKAYWARQKEKELEV